MERSRGVLIGVSILAVVAASCGTRVDKEAFYASLQQDPGSVVTDAPSQGADGEGGPVAEPSVLGTTVRTQGSSEQGASSGGNAPSRASVAIPGVSREVVGDVIRVGIHVPVTGAAPLPSNFTDSLDVVEAFTEDNPIHGRTLQIVLEDDAYDPARGLAACRKLADSNILFVIGHTMPTVQEGCTDLFHERRIPYLMRGIPEETLDGRPLAYFGTPSDDHQARLLADYALKNLRARSRVSAVVTENDQPVSAREFRRGIEAGGGTIGTVENSVPRQSDFGPIIQKLRQVDAEIVFLNIAPVDAIKIAVQSESEGYHPTWIGEGTHWNYNLSMESAGKALDGAVVFSPWPSIDTVSAREYKQAFSRYNPKAQPDDIGMIIWGWMMMVRQAMLDAGPKLSRYTLVRALNSLQFNAPYWNPVRYTSTDHRGPTTVAVFRGDGQAKRWVQIEGFRSSF